MGVGDTRSQAAIGFLTVREHEQQGFVGGYLILNAAGRPLEFHCTAPVKPSRAQQILYGPTWRPYLYGEQIGQTLLAKASAQPLAVCTDVELAMSVRPFVKLPVAWVLAEAKAPRGASPDELAALPVDGACGHAGRACDCRECPSAATEAVPASPAAPVWRLDSAHGLGANLNTFHLGRNQLAVLADEDADRAAFEKRVSQWGDFDLSEPFLRIQEAVDEALKGGRS